MFQIDVMSRIPVYEQIIEQTQKFVIIGIMNPGDKFPSVRSLSSELSVNPNTIQKAIAELDRQGIVVSVPGKGSFIADNAKNVICEIKRGLLNDLRSMVKELLLAGVDKDEIIKIVEEESND